MKSIVEHEAGLKTFTGRTMSEALAKVKREMGTDAVILQTRCVDRGGVLGLGARTHVEITATRDARALRVRGLTSGRGEAEGDGSAVRGSVNKSTQTGREKGIASPPGSEGVCGPARLEGKNRPTPSDADMLREIQAIRDMVRTILSNNNVPGRLTRPESTRAPAETAAVSSDAPAGLIACYTRLVERCVSDELARDILRRVQVRLSVGSNITPPQATERAKNRLKGRRDAAMGKTQVDPVRVEAALLQCVEELLPLASPIEMAATGRPTVVALVGPTGVGKTTTLAKLAATMKLREGRRVGLLTLDTYRIAAVEQIRTYANILKMPLAVVHAPEDLQTAIDGLEDLELVLIDTIGRGPRDAAGLAELGRYFDAARPDQVHLVLSGVTGESANREAIDAYARLGTTHVILTKLDEVAEMGILLNVLNGVKLRLSYLTGGQSVPDDIEAGSQRRLARLLLGMESAGVGANPAACIVGSAPADQTA